VTACDLKRAGGQQELRADLVVDASGHGAPTLAMLKATGLPLPEETVIGSTKAKRPPFFHHTG